jgi:hypothetical protein
MPHANSTPALLHMHSRLEGCAAAVQQVCGSWLVDESTAQCTCCAVAVQHLCGGVWQVHGSWLVGEDTAGAAALQHALCAHPTQPHLLQPTPTLAFYTTQYDGGGQAQQVCEAFGDSKGTGSATQHLNSSPIICHLRITSLV